MAQWNLSVDLRGRGTHLNNALRDSARNARTLGSDVRATEADVRSLGRQRLNRLANSTDHTAARMRNLAREIEQVERRLSGIGDVRLAIHLDDLTGSNTSGLHNLQRVADDTADTLSRLRRRALRTAEAFDELGSSARSAAGNLDVFAASARTTEERLTAIRTSVTELNNSSRDLDTTISGLAGRIGGLRNPLSGTTRSLAATSTSAGSAADHLTNLKIVAGLLASALFPIAAAAVPIAAGLGAAGIAAGVFGVAIAGQIKDLTDAAEAQTAYEEAVSEHGATSTEAAEAELARARVLKDMAPATRETAAAYQVLTDRYQAWSDSLSDDTMPVATKAMGLFSDSLDHATPLVRGVAGETSHFLDVLAGGMQTAEFDEFMDDFTTFAVSTLSKATTGVVHFSRAMNTGAIGADVREFLDYARAHTPAVVDTLGELFRVVLKVGAAAAEAGVGMLAVVNALARMINAIPTDTLTLLLQVAFALKAVQLAGAGLALVGPVIAGVTAAVSGFVRAARFGGIAAAIGGVTQALSRMQRVTIGLGVLAATVIAINQIAKASRGAPPDVDRLTTSLKELAITGKATGELGKTFGDLDGLVGKMKKFREESQKLAEMREGGATGFGRVPILDDIGEWIGDKLSDIQDGQDSVEALKADFQALDEALTGLATGGHAQVAADSFALITAAAKKQGVSLQEVKDLMPGYQSALADMKAEQDLAAAGMGVFGKQALETKAQLDAQKASADGLRQAVQALNEVNRAALGGMIGFEQAIDDAAEAAEKNAGALTMTHGKLDLNSQAARDASTALQNLGTKTDEAAASARAANAPWAEVNAIYQRGREQIINLGQAMGLTEPQARQLAESIINIPEKKEIKVEMERDDALAGLDEVIKKIEATPGAKSVKVNALTDEAKALLGDIGYQTEKLPNGKVQVTAIVGNAVSGLQQVKAARDALSDRTITVTTVRRTVTQNDVARPQQGEGNLSKYANGGIVHAANGLFVPGYAPRRDTVPAMLSEGEGVLVPETVLKLGRATGLGGAGVIKSLNAWGRYGTAMRFADGGTVPTGTATPVQRFASGGFVYAPTGMRRDTGAVQSRYDATHQPITREDYNKAIRAQADAVDRLRDAEAKLRAVRKDKKSSPAEIAAAERAVARSRRSLATATEKATKAEQRYHQIFSLTDWAKTLSDAVKANNVWEANLKKIASRGGADVVDMLRDLGEEGAQMVAALAGATNKQFTEIVNNLRKLGPLAKASLADFTTQLTGANKAQQTFQENLAKLSAQGYGDLAAMLAAQGDEAAMKLAAEAVKDRKKADTANKAAKSNSAQLSQDELATLLQIIAAVKSSKTGIHDVAATTGLGEDEIITVATKGSGQIKKALGDRATRFLSDLARAGKGLAYANGGIREGIYSTRGGAVTFAEPSTGGEAFIPLGSHLRSRALPVLAEAARRHGVGLVDARAGGQVVVVRETGDTYNVPITATYPGSTAEQIQGAFERKARRARRGGVAYR
ncbi:hypothetical protein ACFWG5_34725 [Streptomyces hydrogenans]|uniref:hypothetical protein n=1 Tax=Streptomyces hydrogenans TaxID=1873719 RepID=UPI00364E9EC7